eukprot:COSAG02_NODE_19438_length_882_cov_0.950192_1_plen_103_part_10
MCIAGFSDDECQTDFDECAAEPCVHGTCAESNNDGSIPLDSFRCTCEPGWGGARCTVDADECASRPCVNGGVCSDSLPAAEFGFYACYCTNIGFTGANCEIYV